MMYKLDFKADRSLDFIGLGRLCIDLNADQFNRPMEETSSFTKYVGGSPANIAIGAARLGLKSGFIGKVSDDQMGRFIVSYLKNNSLDTTGVSIDHTGAVTGLAFTEIKSPEDCSILMYRDNVADLKLDTANVSEDYIKRSKALLISGTHWRPARHARPFFSPRITRVSTMSSSCLTLIIARIRGHHRKRQPFIITSRLKSVMSLSGREKNLI